MQTFAKEVPGEFVGETFTESGLADSILRRLVDESVLFVTLGPKLILV
jgi:hypothetical protein